jgi:hypothetical protein
MKRSRINPQSRVTAFMAMLFGAIFTILLLPAYGQQEVDPTWYDPWTPNAVAHSAQPQTFAHPVQSSLSVEGQQAARFASAAGNPANSQAKNTKLDQSRRNDAQKSARTPSSESSRGATRLTGSEIPVAKTLDAESPMDAVAANFE